jgi:RNA polymerase subunit RPABC4/transcription elongation factor Spt4
MEERKQCPDCDSYDTERVFVDWFTDGLEGTRVCGNCDSQFTNNYRLFEQEIDEVPTP